MTHILIKSTYFFATYVYIFSSIFFPAATNSKRTSDHQPIKIECKKCGQIFQKAYDLIKHQDDFHNNQPNISGEAAKVKLPCRIKACGEFFSSMKDLIQHEKKYHPKRNNKIGSLNGILLNKKIVFNEDPKFSAEEKLLNGQKKKDGMKSPHKKGLLIPEQKKKTPKPPKYGDIRCVDRIGASIQHIKKADRTKCALCNNRDFGSNITLEKHINSAHSNAANRCGLCTMVFVSMDELKEHYTNQHGI